MTETLPNEQAFPIPASHTVQYGSTRTVYGMTKREYFAAMVMQGITANMKLGEDSGYQTIAEWSVKQADALIEALNKQP
jgi:hypothetical protein